MTTKELGGELTTLGGKPKFDGNDPKIAEEVGKSYYRILRANLQNKIYLTKMDNDPDKTSFFGVCANCGRLDWMELFEDDADKKGSPRFNWVCEDGSIRYPNMKKIKKMVYNDVVCSKCEAPVVLFQANLFTDAERAKMVAQTREERIKIAERYLIADNL